MEGIASILADIRIAQVSEETSAIERRAQLDSSNNSWSSGTSTLQFSVDENGASVGIEAEQFATNGRSGSGDTDSIDRVLQV